MAMTEVCAVCTTGYEGGSELERRRDNQVELTDSEAQGGICIGYGECPEWCHWGAFWAALLVLTSPSPAVFLGSPTVLWSLRCPHYFRWCVGSTGPVPTCMANGGGTSFGLSGSLRWLVATLTFGQRRNCASGQGPLCVASWLNCCTDTTWTMMWFWASLCDAEVNLVAQATVYLAFLSNWKLHNDGVHRITLSRWRCGQLRPICCRDNWRLLVWRHCDSHGQVWPVCPGSCTACWLLQYVSFMLALSES